MTTTIEAPDGDSGDAPVSAAAVTAPGSPEDYPGTVTGGYAVVLSPGLPGSAPYDSAQNVTTMSPEGLGDVLPHVPHVPTAAEGGYASDFVRSVRNPNAPEHVGPDLPRALSSRTQDETLSFCGSLAGSFAVVWLISTQIMPFTGRVGFVLLWFVAFVAMYAGVTAMANPRTVVVDRVAGAVVRAGAIMVFGALLSAIVFTFLRGAEALVHINFFTEDMAGVRPTSSLDHGGILHAVVGSLIEIGIAVLFALPLGVGTAVYMNEVGGPFSRVVRTVVEAMTALPSIVAGLFIYTVLIVTLGISRTGIAATAAIFVMMLPIIARASDVVLRVMPAGLREASLALGASKWQTVRMVVLPTVRSGLATALILGIARGVGETSPVLLTSGASTFMNTDPFNEPMNSLPLFVFSAVRSGEPLFIARGFGAASVLLMLVLLLFVITRFLARQKVGSR